MNQYHQLLFWQEYPEIIKVTIAASVKNSRFQCTVAGISLDPVLTIRATIETLLRDKNTVWEEHLKYITSFFWEDSSFTSMDTITVTRPTDLAARLEMFESLASE